MRNIKTSTIIRTVTLLLALVNNCLVMAGKSPLPIADAEVETILSGIFTVAAAVWAWWENNSFTPAAIEADKVYDEIKEREKYESA